MKKALRVILIVLAVFAAVLLAIYVYHRVQSNREAPLRTPLGELVEVDGGHMCVYTEGAGDRTLVFLSGAGTCSPILDFRSLYSLLSGSYRVAVVEKFGYGASDNVDRARDIGTILADTRAALRAAGVEPPYVLCPHSMSGLEALYWAGQYPEEVSAIVGLDMSVPEAYDGYQAAVPLLRLAQAAANIGLTRWIPGVAESDAIRYGTLTQEEKAIYQAVFYSRTATDAMLSEAALAGQNAETVKGAGTPQVPVLLFASNGEGTGWDAGKWVGFQENFLRGIPEGRLVKLDCPHYVHDFAYEAISEDIVEFLSG